jgi:predicted RNA-binding Zn-ribbon protein involved in translation (DUF1610 family)
VTDLERFFERLVRNLLATDPAGVTRPVSLMDVRSTILPYRTNRRALALESSEEYEELLVRLCAGEAGLVITQPSDVADWCERQMASLTPDLSGIPGQAAATITVSQEALARVLGQVSADAIAKNAASPASEPMTLRPDKCIHCDAGLPANRAVNFCPTCGRSITTIPCDACGADLEPGWRFCINCGHEVTEAGTPPA